jgi:PKD repeat protein
MRFLLFATLLAASLSGYSQLCYTARYNDTIFHTVKKTTDVLYAKADPYGALSSSQYLLMDIYEPAGDTLQYRPVIFYAFGGAFLIGDKAQPPVPLFCDYFARLGYVVISINYRIGFNTTSSGSTERAVYRAVQDLRAAIRYVSQRHNFYRIDTGAIITTGTSAGCFAGLHSNYFEESDRPQSTFGIALEPSDMGCLDCSGNTDNYQRTPRTRVIINQWGAILDTAFIQNQPDENCSVISFHGTSDNLVPYEYGHPFSYPVFPNVYGSKPIHERLNNLGIRNRFVPLAGFGHEPELLAPELNDTIWNRSRIFLYEEFSPLPQQLAGLQFACKGQQITYSVAARNCSSYCWEVAGKGVLIHNYGNSITVLAQDSGTITVSCREVTYLGFPGNATSFTTQVVLPPAAMFGLTSNELDIQIQDSSLYFTAANWNMGDGHTYSTTPMQYTYGTPGTYSIQLIATNQGCADTFARTAVVDTCPVAAFTYKIMGNSAQFIPAATNAATYNWSFGTGDSSTGVVQVFTYAVPGTYPVSLTATNSLGCSNTSLQFVTIAAPNSLQSPFADFMTAYPNPFTDAISIESGEPVSVNLLTIDGRLLYQLPEASKHTISAAYLSPAIYILEVRKYQTTRRFKVQKL